MDDSTRNGLRASPRLWGWLAALVLLLSTAAGATVASPRAGQVEILLSDDGDAYRELAGVFQSELSRRCEKRCTTPPEVRVRTVDDWDPRAPRDLLVAVGNQAALHGLVSHPRRLLYGLIPKATWRSLQQVYPTAPGQASAVFLDQPLARQFDLLDIVLKPDQRRVGVLLGPESAQLLPALRDNAERLNMTLVVRQAQSPEEVGPGIEDLASRIDVLLAVPDPMVFNRDTLYGILLTSYGARVPVAGYSQALADAGAMIALYTSVTDAARELAETSARHLQQGGDLPPPGPSQYFQVAVNRNVARSLGYDLPETEELHRLLRSEGAGNGAAQTAQ